MTTSTRNLAIMIAAVILALYVTSSVRHTPTKPPVHTRLVVGTPSTIEPGITLSDLSASYSKVHSHNRG